MPTIAEVRAKYPQYKDLSDQQLAEGLHKKFYSDLPFDDFAQRIGYSAKQEMPPVPTMGGMGGFNPMLSRLAGATDEGSRELGMTPENVESPLNALGPAETALQVGTGAVATPAAGIAGIGQSIWNALLPKSMEGPAAADRVRQVQSALTYQPRTGAGQAMSRVAGLPGEIYQAGTTRAGELVTDNVPVIGPELGTAIKTAGDIAPSLIGARMVPKGTARHKPTETYQSVKNEIPTTEQLKKASQAAYANAKDAGIIVQPESYSRALGKVQRMATEEGVDPTLHPKSTAVLKRLEEADGKPLTLHEAETLRKIALDAEDDLNPVTRQPTPDSRLAGKIVDELDESIEALSANDEARALWSRSRKSQMIDQAIHRAEIRAGAHYTQAGMEHALRQEFKQIAMNPRRMRGLTQEQRAAIEKVAKGGPLENTLRTLGKFDPTTSGVAALASIGTSAGLAPLTAGGSMLLPGLGFVGRRVATKMTAGNVDKARAALVGRGLPTAAPQTRAAPTLPNAAQRAVGASTEPRLPASIVAEIEKLIQRAGKEAPKAKPGSASARAIWEELARLQEELALAESRGATQGAPDGTLSQ